MKYDLKIVVNTLREEYYKEVLDKIKKEEEFHAKKRK